MDHEVADISDRGGAWGEPGDEAAVQDAPDALTVVMLAGRGFHTVALRTAGAVYAWGYTPLDRLF